VTIQAAVVSGFAQFSYPDDKWLGVIHTSTALALLGAVGTFFGLIRTRAAVTYTTEVVGELLRVTWPSREESLRAATTVVGTALFIAVMIALFDFAFKNLADVVLFTER